MRLRRDLLALTLAAPWLSLREASSQGANEQVIERLDDSDYPSFDAIDPLRQFGAGEPSQAQRERARLIWENAPRGPQPIDVANYFVDGFAATDPDAVSQWPRAAAWNPLVVEFFRATRYQAENDMVPWCAAFVNWCLLRTGRRASGSAASQSFLDERFFDRTGSPKVGDLVVFTCYSKTDGRSVGLGHVAFVGALPNSTHVLCTGGNQASDGRSMICRRPYPLGPLDTTRTIGGRRVPVTFRFNTYVSIA